MKEDIKYISPFTDFGFKKIFGEEASKPLLIDFLNTLLPPENQIKTLSFKNSEQLGPTKDSRIGVFDIYCQNESGEYFIVELQKARQNYFKDRTVYYSSFPICEQNIKGDWDFHLKAVFCIGILDFRFDDYTCEHEKREVMHTVKLKDQYGHLFYDKLTYIYLEMPNFNKSESELESRLDRWLYFIQHLEDLQEIPRIFEGEMLFEKAFEKAEFSKFTYDEYRRYQLSLKDYRDRKNENDYSKMVGEEGGIKIGLEVGKEERMRLEALAEALAEELAEEKRQAEMLAEERVVAQQEYVGKNLKEKFIGVSRLLEMGMTLLQASLFSGIAPEELENA